MNLSPLYFQMPRSTEDHSYIPSWKRLVIVQLFLGYVFVITGLFVNLLQLLTACFVWPFDRALYRKINYHLATVIWSRKSNLFQLLKLFALIFLLYRINIRLSMVVRSLDLFDKRLIRDRNFLLDCMFSLSLIDFVSDRLGRILTLSFILNRKIQQNSVKKIQFGQEIIVMKSIGYLDG